jgi:translation initiation factor IF-2
MSEANTGIRLKKVATEFNIGTTTIIDFLAKKGLTIESSPNAKLTMEMYSLIQKEYSQEKSAKEESIKVGLEHARLETITIEAKKTPQQEESEDITLEELLIKTADDYPKASDKKQEKKVAADKGKAAPKQEETVSEETPLVPDTEAVIPELVEPVEPAKETAGGLVIHGAIDLDSLNLRTKPPRKTKEEKEEEQRKKREADKKKKEESKAAAVKDLKPPEETAPAEEPKTEEKEVVIAEVPEGIPTPQAKKQPEIDFFETKVEKLTGPTILGKMDLPSPVKKIKKIEKKAPVASSDEETPVEGGKKKRKRIKAGAAKFQQPTEAQQPQKKAKLVSKKRPDHKVLASEEDIQKQIKETLARLTPTGKSKSSKLRRQKRDIIHQKVEIQRKKEEEEETIIKVTEFVTVKELASLMNVDVNEIISTCMALGMFVSINQRLDAETLSIVADEFGYKVEFVSIEVQEAINQFEDTPEDLLPRHPIVTVMGHVDHGKTSLLDYIRKTNVIAGEAGGITQHIGAYEVSLENGKKITFLDTPGHEAFTAMRARGAKVTDIAIIVIAADDQVMPQTREAINHAQAAGVPIIFAINKIDKPGANPEKVKEQLANMNLLVEDWGGKYQSQDLSAKQGLNVDTLMEKVLLEAEMLDLKCNLKRPAEGTVIESSLDKGRGYIAKLLVQNGTLNTGDVVLAGCFHGRVKAMYNERNQRIQKAGPGSPVLLLGLHGAPQAGDIFNVLADEKEAKAIANKRFQLQREQGIRTQKHITLDEIGRRIAIGDFKELNIIVKGDVDGSVEALSDSLLKLSTSEAQVNVIHKSVGAVSETDVMLASASDAIIVAFQVRPSVSARKLAEQEQIDIRLYSIIYQAIDEIKSALEGMLAPEIEEKITSNVEVREVFKITKVGSVAGCMVLDGKINKNSKIRIIRDGIVIYTGFLGSLKRFKDDVKEVATGYECGLNIENFNDIKVGDIVESYEELEIKRKL